MKDTPLRKKIRLIASAALAKKAKEVVSVDLRKLPSICDYFIIASGDSTPQLNAIADNIEKELVKSGCRLKHREGSKTALWILLDYGDIAVHIFHKDLRGFYNLEKLWHDAPQKKLRESRPRRKKARTTGKVHGPRSPSGRLRFAPH